MPRLSFWPPRMGWVGVGLVGGLLMGLVGWGLKQWVGLSFFFFGGGGDVDIQNVYVELERYEYVYIYIVMNTVYIYTYT